MTPRSPPPSKKNQQCRDSNLGLFTYITKVHPLAQSACFWQNITFESTYTKSVHISLTKSQKISWDQMEDNLSTLRRQYWVTSNTKLLIVCSRMLNSDN